MFSSTFLVAKSSKSIYRAIPSQHLTVCSLENQLGSSLGSPSTSRLSSSLSITSKQTGSRDENRRKGFIFDFLIKSISSGILIGGVGSLFSSNSSTSNSHLSFADFPKETTWATVKDQFQYPTPNQNVNGRKKSKFLFGGKNVPICH